MPSRLQWLAIAFVSIAIALLLHADILIRHALAPADRVALTISGPRTDVGDNYYYFSMLKHVQERLSEPVGRLGDPDGGDHRNINSVTNTYAIALYAGNFLYQIGNFVSSDSRWAVLITSLLHTTLLALTFSAFVVMLFGKSITENSLKWALLAVTAGMIFIDAFGYTLLLGRPYWSNILLTSYSNPTRLVNPSLFWAAGLTASAYIVHWLRNGLASRGTIVAAMLAGLVGMFSISVGSTLLIALGLSIIIEGLMDRRIHWQLVAVALATFSGIIWSLFLFKIYAATQLGQELRHGAFLGLNLKWQFIILLGLIPYAWRYFGREKYFCIGLIGSAMLVGMVCESFYLGDRLWLRGADAIIWGIIIALIGIKLAEQDKNKSFTGIKTNQLAIPAMILFAFFVFVSQRPSLDSWKGFIERDKWELLNWIDINLQPGSIVASADIEDSFLIPIYTKAKPLYSMYGLTNRTRDDELRRFFHNMHLYGRCQNFLATTLNLNQNDVSNYLSLATGNPPSPLKNDVIDATIFLELVVYLSYTPDLANALTNPEQHRKLAQLLISRANEGSQSIYSLDFAIIERVSQQGSFLEWPVVFRNSKYMVVKKPEGARKGLPQESDKNT